MKTRPLRIVFRQIRKILLYAFSYFFLEHRSEIPYVQKSTSGSDFCLRKIACFQKGFCIIDPHSIQILLRGCAVEPAKLPSVISGRNTSLLCRALTLPRDFSEQDHQRCGGKHWETITQRLPPRGSCRLCRLMRSAGENLTICCNGGTCCQASMKKKLPRQTPVTFYKEQGDLPHSCDSLRAAFGGCSLAQRCGASHPTRYFLAALGRATAF